MLFSAPTFLFVFLPLTLAAWFLTRRSKIVLVAASLIFYGWGEPRLIFLLLFVIVFNYAMGELFEVVLRRKLFLIIGLTVDIGLLVVFKYAGFIVGNLNVVLGAVGWGQLPVPQIPLPLGISFFTFQAIAYLVDIYSLNIAPAHSLFRFALFKSFFPQLIAGPIVRYQTVARDFAGDYSSPDLFASGARRFIVGLAKKVIIADSLGTAVDAIFSTPAGNLSAMTAWAAALGFALQIYFDFSGYSDMAIGMGWMFGVRLPENFNYPYIAASMQDFWRRWHISLSTWFRDYVYFPLGGNRHGTLRTYANLVLVFGLCGLWHGATWSFVVWGLYNGVFLILERGPFGALLHRLPRFAQHGYLIGAVLIGWVFFRAPSLEYAVTMIGVMFGSQGIGFAPVHPLEEYVSEFQAIVACVAIVCSLPWRSMLGDGIRQPILGPVYRFGDVLVVAGGALLCGGFVASQTHNAFIYFRF